MEANTLSQKLASIVLLPLMLSGCLGSGLFQEVPASGSTALGNGIGNGLITIMPTNLTINPPSPSLNPVAEITGRTVPGCSVQVYSSDDCTGSVVGTGQADFSGNFDIQTISMADGTYAFSARCTNGPGSFACSSQDLPWILKTTSPTISLGMPNYSDVNHLTPVSFVATYSGATSITLRASDITQSTTGNANCSVLVSGSGSSTRTITLSNCTGDGTVGISIAAGTANDDPGNLATASGASSLVRIDNTGFTSGVFTPASGDYATLPSTVILDVPETLQASSVSPADFSLSGTCPGLSIASTTVSGSSVFLSIAGVGNCSMLSTYQVTTNLNSMNDAAGNPGSGTASVSYRMNNVGPTSATFNIATGPVNPFPSALSVTYNTTIDATTVSASDFTLSGTCSGATISSVNTSGSTATLSLSNLGACTNNQTLIVTANFAGVKDASGNSGNGSSAATYTLDTVGPTAALSPTSGTVSTMPTSVQVTFSSDIDMATVSISDFSLSGSCAATLGSISISGLVATVALNNTTTCLLNTNIQFTVNLATVRDTVGNPGVGTQSTNYVFDNVGPNATLSVNTGSVGNFPSTIKVTYSADTNMNTVSAASVSIGGSCSAISVSSFTKNANVATVALANGNACIDGDTLSVVASLANVKDAVGNPGSGTVSATLQKDQTAPSADISPATASFNPLPTSAQVSFSANTDMSTVLPATFNLSGSTCSTVAISSISKSGQTATVNFSGTAACLNTRTLQLNAVMTGVQSNTGFPGDGTVSATYTVDTQGPSSVLSVIAGPVNPLPTQVAINFSGDTNMATVTPATFSLLGSTCSAVTISSVTKSGQVATVNLAGTTSCLSLQTVVLNTILSGVQDQVGNYGLGTSLATYIYDNIAPTVALSVAAGTYHTLPTSVALNFSADTDMTTVNPSNFVLLGTCPGVAISSVTTSGTVATVNFSGTAGCATLSTMILTTSLVGVKDKYGNVAIGSQSAIYIKGL